MPDSVFVFDDDEKDVSSVHHLIVPPVRTRASSTSSTSSSISLSLSVSPCQYHDQPPQRRRSFKARLSFSAPAKDSEEVLLQSNYTANTTPSFQRTLCDFEQVSLIGIGSYGAVHLVRDTQTSRLFARKTIAKAKICVDKTSLKNSRNERDILAKISHPSIVKLFYTFHDHESINFILEYIPGGELFHHMRLRPGGVFSEHDSAIYLAQIADALHHLHSVGIVYRDLKPENCMLDQRGHIVLTDFGLCSMEEKCHSILGTPEFTAPEVLAGEVYSYQADWWSFGVMMYDMLTGKTPFRGKNTKEIQTKIMSKKNSVKFDGLFLSQYAIGLMQRLLNKNPEKRFKVDDKFELFKKERFFRNIDWNDLKNMTPPIVPVITDLELAENFDIDEVQEIYKTQRRSIRKHSRQLRGTMESIGENSELDMGSETVMAIPIDAKRIDEESFDDSMFKGFSFTAGQSLLERHLC